MLQAIKYSRGNLQILNQLLLPFEQEYEEIKTIEQGHSAIATMKVRGAPAIAICAALTLAVDINTMVFHIARPHFTTAKQLVEYIDEQLSYLKTSRPTAVNLSDASAKLSKVVHHELAANQEMDQSELVRFVAKSYLDAAEQMLQKDIDDNQKIGKFGAEFIQNNTGLSREITVLTHCNTGSLATAGWGTALGVIRELHQQGKLHKVYCTETRPYNQGSRLTAFELVHDKLPCTLICDSMASALMSHSNLTCVIVGADRVAANGDTANKVGTFQLAISCHYHRIPFLVAAPCTSIDLSIASGEQIPIEQRPAMEMTTVRGRVLQDEKQSFTTATVEVAAPGIQVWNPAFDVTPAKLISGIITEKGVAIKPSGSDNFDLKSFMLKHVFE